MIRSSLLVSAFILSAGIITSCNKKNNVTCDGSAPTYDTYVKTVVDNNCVSCHANYATYSGLSTITSNGKFEDEVLIRQKMPQNGSLSSDELSKLQCWVENGFPEN